MTFLSSYTYEDDEITYETVNAEYSFFTTLSCVFPNMRPGLPRLLSTAQYFLYMIFVIVNTIALGITLYLSMDDATISMQTLHFIVMNLIAFTLLLSYMLRRPNFARFHRDIGENIQTYDKETNETINDFKMDLVKKRKMFNIAVPMFIGVAGFLIVCLNPIYDYFTGQSGNEVYTENGVSKNLAIPCWTPFGSDNIYNFFLSFILQAGDHVVIVSTIVTANIVMFVMSRHVLTELILLMAALKRLPQRTQSTFISIYGKPYTGDAIDFRSDLRYEHCYNICLGEIVKHHQRIIRLFNEMNASWEIIFITFFFTSTFSIAMSGILLMFGDGKVTTVINAVTMGVTEIFDVFYICWCGKLISEASENLYQVLYETNWFNGTKGSAKILLIFMSMAKSPLALYFNSVNKLPANLQTFSDLMNTAYSYFNLLYAFKNES
ncbi:hypothetical protein O3M35_010004 [Rhynocoris fuscipes]|uniref:Odorant receptor n=1 Tax=Rhynocoris fuscipes TaxID=488301 RepID=A0AAW1CYP2_9HEMI